MRLCLLLRPPAAIVDLDFLVKKLLKRDGVFADVADFLADFAADSFSSLYFSIVAVTFAERGLKIWVAGLYVKVGPRARTLVYSVSFNFGKISCSSTAVKRNSYLLGCVFGVSALFVAGFTYPGT